MMSDAPISLAQVRSQRLGVVSDETLLWLALPPVWTAPLAAACGFPTGDQTPDDFFANAVRNGLAQSDRPAAGAFSGAPPSPPPTAGESAPSTTPAAGETARRTPDLSDYDASLLADLGLASAVETTAASFWAAPGARSDILTRILNDPQRGARLVAETAAQIGQRIQKALDMMAVPVATRRWSALATALRKHPRDAAMLLDRRLDDLLRPGAGDTAEALRWIEAASPLAELFGGDLLAATQRAGRRLELYHRRDFDRRHLSRFLERREQMQAFLSLLDSPPQEWALHYIGLGGVGKTMLVRHLTLLLTEDERFKERAACARIDFDHLSPDYPARAPGLLLENLAAELLLYAPGAEATKAFTRFHDRVTNLHGRLPAPALGALPPLPTGDREFQDVLRAFVEALRTLPQPVVFILDTCEELARISAEGEVPHNVRATFAMLEQMQSEAQRARVTVRVIFCGRRPLASVGAGWEWPAARPLPTRPYLRLHAIRGFTHEEANTFLTTRAGVPVEPADRLAAIIERSPEYGRLGQASADNSAGLRFSDPHQAPADVPRCSPFDLDLYATWVREMPTLDAQTIRTADADQYIDLRIMGRLQPAALRTLMPAVALLGRFDLPMLTAAAGDLPAAADGRASWQSLFEAVGRQEWVERQEPFLEVDRLLLPKLRAYFMRRDEAALDLAALRGGAALQQLTLRAPQDALSVTHLDNALRLLLSYDAAAAAAWWAQIEARFTHPDAWPWLETVCDRLLGRNGAVATYRPTGWWSGQPLTPEAQAEWEEGRARLQAEGHFDGSDTPLRAAVLATYSAARLNQRRRDNAFARWRECLAILEQTPQPAPPRLHLRALAGCLATAASDDATPAQLNDWLRRLDPGLTSELAADHQAQAALLAAAETGRAPVGLLLDRLPEQEPELRAWAALLRARELSANGQPDEALALARQALALRAPLDAMRPAAAWLDWLPPADMDAAVRLEFAHLAYPALLSPAQTLAEIGPDLPAPGSLNADRLGTLLLQMQAALAPPTFTGFPSPAAAAASATGTPVEIHRRIPPLAAALTIEVAQTGAVDQAIGALRELQTQTESAADQAGRQAVLSAQATIVRRFRLRDVRLGADLPTGLVTQAVYPQITPQTLAAAGLAAPEPTPSAPLLIPEMSHSVWRSTPVLRRSDYEAAARIPLGAGTPAAGEDLARFPFAVLSLLLDQQECALLAAEWAPDTLPTARPFDTTPFDADAWVPLHPQQPQEGLTLLLRADVLLATHPLLSSGALQETVQRLGVRRAALLALDEGELLALRLPVRAVPLLTQAAVWAVEAGDPTLAFLAQATLALAAVRSERSGDLAQPLQEGWRAMEASWPQLAPAQALTWAELEQAAQGSPRFDTDDGSYLEGAALVEKTLARAPRGWRPWLARVIAAQAALWKLQAKPNNLAGVLQWVEAQTGIKAADGQVRLPPEFEGLRKAPAWQPPQPSTSPKPSRRRYLASALLIFVCLIAAVSAGLLLFPNTITGDKTPTPTLIVAHDTVTATITTAPGLTPGTPTESPATPTKKTATPAAVTATPSPTPKPAPTPAFDFLDANVLKTALTGSAIFLALIFSLALRSWLRLHSRPRLELRAGVAELSDYGWRNLPPVEMTLTRLRWRWRLRWPFAVQTRQTVAQGLARAGDLASYSQAGPLHVPEAIQEALRADQEQLRKQFCDLALVLEKGLAPFGWEGLLTTTLANVKRPLDVPFRFYRYVPGGRPTSRETLAISITSLTSDFTMQSLAQEVWQAALDAGLQFSMSSLDEPLLETVATPTSPVSVLHLLAAPTHTPSGPRWKMGGEAPMMQQSKVAGPARRQRLLAVEELLERFSGVRLVIMQAPPWGQLGVRTESEYEEAALLRELGAQIALQAAAFVAIIPPLPADVATVAAQPLVNALIRLQRAGGLGVEPTQAELLAALREAQQVTALPFEPLVEEAASAGLEAAWDFCLYTPDL